MTTKLLTVRQRKVLHEAECILWQIDEESIGPSLIVAGALVLQAIIRDADDGVRPLFATLRDDDEPCQEIELPY